jgi:hypothetical protein
LFPVRKNKGKKKKSQMGKRTGESKEKRADVFGQIRPNFA